MKPPSLTFLAMASVALFVGCGKRERELETQIIELQTKQAEELKQLKAEVDRLSGVYRSSHKKHTETQEELRALHANLGVKWSELFKENSGNEIKMKYIQAAIKADVEYRQNRVLRRARGEKVEPMFCANGPATDGPREVKKLEKNMAANVATLDEIEKNRAHLKSIIDRDKRE